MNSNAELKVIYGNSCPTVGGTGHIDVHFLEYSDTCWEDLNTNRCDPMFTFCLSTPQKGRLKVDNCNYDSTAQSADVFGNTNYINTEHLTSIGGLKNPWSVQVQKFIEPSVMLVVQVIDADYIDDDHMQTFAKTLTETVWPDKEHSIWENRIMSQNSHTIKFKVRMYCDPYYYTSACDKYCKPDDSSSGHFTCDANGDKICMPGWQGSQCTEDTDECALGFCVRGTCKNTPGDYSCDCPEHYTGKNCSYLKNPCQEQPCLNGGTCFAHATEHVYICQCMPNWEGINCQMFALRLPWKNHVNIVGSVTPTRILTRYPQY
ncbi:unnamed protein product [Candidula unifasciata]|uniref:Delta-like protein n=1 Tax=Candidula unifasciata TaxID=100452 RepID=A0A8S3YKG4_9EUPU|nr:unnamed protein product [Candidula unifasciata]